MASVNVKNIVNQLQKNRSVVVSDSNTRKVVGLLMSLGDIQFAGADAELRRDGALVLSLPRSKKKGKVAVVPASNGDTGVTRQVTDKGLTVPAALLERIGVSKNSSQVYLRPISSDLFLVNRQRGSYPGTIAYSVYADGRVVINNTTLAKLFGEDARGCSVVFDINGSTVNSLRVQLV